nr:unnamed protein product [Spirometra erinaceieuropaei]
MNYQSFYTTKFGSANKNSERLPVSTLTCSSTSEAEYAHSQVSEQVFLRSVGDLRSDVRRESRIRHPMGPATDLKNALAVETLSDLLRQNYDGGDGQPTAQDLIELMGHRLKTFFTFEGTTYEQIKGTPMGSPISGLIAEAVLQKLERRLFEEYKPKFWARYVDDTFVIIDQDKINYMRKY